MHSAARAKEIAESYYDSSDADGFYSSIWGGEDIHIGIYEAPDEPIATASRRTVVRMASRLPNLSPGMRVVDLGAGYGGAARYLASNHGCHVVCVNLSEAQNERNRGLNQAAELTDKVQVMHANFEQLPLPDESCDVVWSQDAILHSGARRRVLSEVRRILRPGGSFIFTDPMQSDDCPAGVLGPVLARLQLQDLASVAFYRSSLADLGFHEVEFEDLTGHLIRHYTRVREELVAGSGALRGNVSSEYATRMREGLNQWVNAGRNGHLAWGVLHFRR